MAAVRADAAEANEVKVCTNKASRGRPVHSRPSSPPATQPPVPLNQHPGSRFGKLTILEGCSEHCPHFGSSTTSWRHVRVCLLYPRRILSVVEQ